MSGTTHIDVEFPTGLSFPLAARASVDGGAAVDLQITNVSVAQTVQGQPLSYRLSYSGPELVGSSDDGSELALSVQAGQHVEVETRRKIWAARRDYFGREQLTVGEGGTFKIGDTRFLVRNLPGLDIEIGTTLFDDEGERRTVTSIARLGRGFMELLARRVG